MRLRVQVVCIAALLATGCTGSTKRVEVGREIVSDPTSISVQDFETIGQRMARAIAALPQIQNASQPPTVAFLSVENRSNDYVDKKAFLEKMRTLLIRHSGGKVTFLDRQNLEELRKEQLAKDTGDLTSSREGGQFLGADYFLTGVISSINAAGGSEKTIFRRYSFRLTDAHTSAIIWEDEYETQIYHQRGLIYR
jgi:PBP1b-binding outer membrane lipoprotein LpoB